jgi:hypothetical protein
MSKVSLNIEVWLALYDYQHKNKKRHFLTLKELIHKIQELIFLLFQFIVFFVLTSRQSRMPPHTVTVRSYSHCSHSHPIIHSISFSHYPLSSSFLIKTIFQLEPNLIDVWENYDTFVLKPVIEDESEIFKIHFGSRPYCPSSAKEIVHSVVDEGEFVFVFVFILFLPLSEQKASREDL